MVDKISRLNHEVDAASEVISGSSSTNKIFFRGSLVPGNNIIDILPGGKEVNEQTFRHLYIISSANIGSSSTINIFDFFLSFFVVDGGEIDVNFKTTS
jgi:hypothetical protein